jgi:hypothetical protein
MNMIPFLPFLALMKPEGLLLMRIVGVIGLLVLIPAGFLLWKKQDEWFGRCDDTPSETSGGLMYGRMHVWVLYVGALHLALWFAL